jgi:hypothetical protein
MHNQPKSAHDPPLDEPRAGKRRDTRQGRSRVDLGRGVGPRPLRFPRPPFEPDVRVAPHPALDGHAGGRHVIRVCRRSSICAGSRWKRRQRLSVRHERSAGGRVRCLPADTLTQAKAFYRRHNAVAGVRTLRSRPNWGGRAELPLGSFQRGYCWTCNERPLDDHVELWVPRIRSEAAVPRVNWDRFWSWLETERIACPRDRLWRSTRSS